MRLAENLSYLRQSCGMTQETLAEKLNVSRQTISKWETGESNPELQKLVEVAGLFHCKIDALLTENMEQSHRAYSDVTIVTVPKLRLGRYVVISPQPEDDLYLYLNTWAEKSGLKRVVERPRILGWDFPYVSQEQRNRFGLRGYAGGCVLPEGFEDQTHGVEVFTQPAAEYAKVTVREPFINAFERIPGAYKKIFRFLGDNGIKETPPDERIISCFEEQYFVDGVEMMDIYVHFERD